MACLRFLHWKLTLDLRLMNYSWEHRPCEFYSVAMSLSSVGSYSTYQEETESCFYTLSDLMDGGHLPFRILPCTPLSPVACRNFSLQEVTCRRILQVESSPIRLYCYLESEVMSRLIVMIDLEISIKVLLKGMWSQHNACQNWLSLMTSNMCFWVAQNTVNYFLVFEVQVKMFILVCCMLIKSVLSG